jgi:RNA-splicing ligase RtcB
MIEELREEPALERRCLTSMGAMVFPIGGIAAMDADAGVISPDSLGSDIDCSVCLARGNLQFKDITASRVALY